MLLATAELVKDLWDSQEAERAHTAHLRDYFEGRHKILEKRGARKDGNPYNKIVTNWVEVVADRHTGFLTSSPFRVSDRDVTETDQDEGAKAYAELTHALDLSALDARQIRRAFVYGVGIEMPRLDPAENKIMIDDYDPDEWACLCDDQEKVLLAVRRVELKNGFIRPDGTKVEADETRFYSLDGARQVEWLQEKDGKLTEVAGSDFTRPLNYGGLVPVVMFAVTKQLKSHFSDAFITLQDAYNTAFSELLDDHETDIDALLVLSGLDPKTLTTADPVTGEVAYTKMRELGAITFPDKESTAQYITRGLEFSKMDFVISSIRANIHLMGAVPDLDKIVGATGATSGIALKLAFQSMIEKAEDASKYAAESVSERVRLLNALWQRLGQPTIAEPSVEIKIQPPVNEIEIWTNVGALEPLLARIDRLRLIPSVADPEAALERKRTAEKEDPNENAAKAAGPGAVPPVAGADAGKPGDGANTGDAMHMELGAALAQAGQRVDPAMLRAVADKIRPMAERMLAAEKTKTGA